MSVLAAVQAKLAHLESENGISRRRVRELERELDACKAEVARERTRVMERESVIVQQRENAQSQTHRAGKQERGKGKSTRFEDDGELEERYGEVVEEKKGMLLSLPFYARDPEAYVFLFCSPRSIDHDSSHASRAFDLRIIIPPAPAQGPAGVARK
jgi:hypothetical protein